jgi:DNA-binding transcriptional regulator LsrR (DeoR family)
LSADGSTPPADRFRTPKAATTAAGRTVDQLIEVARRFYLVGETQVEIAKDLGLDPSTVSRYLKRARDEGVIRVEIRAPRRRNVDLGRRLADQYHLSRAIVAPTDEEGGLSSLASVAADYVGTILRTGMCIGLGWGSSLSATVDYLEPGAVSDLEITQLAGGLSSPVPGIQGHELARQLAALYPRSKIHYLHAPSIVDSPAIRDALLSDSSVQTALAAGAGSELALVGIGEIGPKATLLHSAQITPADVDSLSADGVVGSMNGRFFRRDGRPGGHLDDRTIAIEWDQLRAIPTVLAVAAGKHKLAAILGALRTGCLDVLCTDEQTAESLLKAK